VADKLDAINTVLTSGLGEIKVSIDSQTDSLKLDLTAISDKLAGIGKSVLDGFAALDTSLDKLVTAIGKVEVAVDANTKAILTLDTDLKAELKALRDTMEVQGGKIVTAINSQGNVVALALGKDGDLYKVLNLGVGELQDIEAAILANGQSLKDLLAAGNKTAEDILAALGVSQSQMADILQAIKDNKVDLTEVINQLKTANHTLSELLAISDGIYLDKNDYVDSLKLYKYVYITATVRDAASNSTEVDEGIMSLLIGKTMAEPSKEQIVPSTAGTYGSGTIHYHCFWKRIEESKPFLKYTDVVTDKDNKTLLKMEKYYSESVWIVKIYDKCSNGHIYGILVNDARNPSRYVQYYKDELSSEAAKQSTAWNKGLLNKNEAFTGQNQQYMGPIKVKFVSYINETGVFCSAPSAKIYCQSAESGSKISDKAKDGSAYGEYDDPNNKDDGWWTSESNYSKLNSTRDEPYENYIDI